MRVLSSGKPTDCSSLLRVPRKTINIHVAFTSDVPMEFRNGINRLFQSMKIMEAIIALKVEEVTILTVRNLPHDKGGLIGVTPIEIGVGNDIKHLDTIADKSVISFLLYVYEDFFEIHESKQQEVIMLHEFGHIREKMEFPDDLDLAKFKTHNREDLVFCVIDSFLAALTDCRLFYRQISLWGQRESVLLDISYNRHDYEGYFTEKDKIIDDFAGITEIIHLALMLVIPFCKSSDFESHKNSFIAFSKRLSFSDVAVRIGLEFAEKHGINFLTTGFFGLKLFFEDFVTVMRGFADLE